MPLRRIRFWDDGRHAHAERPRAADERARWLRRWPNCCASRSASPGTKIACAEGTCGACTVLVDGRAVLSCILRAEQAEGAAVTTIEGLGDEGALSALQRAFVEEDALQCGFCTAGQVVSATALLAATPRPTSEQVRAAMSGNLCRCGAYPGIERAGAAGGRRAGRRDADGQAAEDDGRDGGPLRGALGARRGGAAGLGGRAPPERGGDARHTPDRPAPGLGRRALRLRRRAARHAARRDRALAACARDGRARRRGRARRAGRARGALARRRRRQAGPQPDLPERAGVRRRAGRRARVRDRRGGASRNRGARAALCGARLRDRRSPGPGGAASAGGSGRVRDGRRRSRHGRGRRDRRGRVRDRRPGAPRARAALRRRAVARRRAARLRVHAGHLGRARPSSRGPSSSIPTACT